MPGAWLQAVKENAAETARNSISQQDQAVEYLLMGLRIRDGIDLKRYRELAGKPLERSAIEHLVDLGMIFADGGRLSVTDQGLMVLNSVIAELAAD